MSKILSFITVFLLAATVQAQDAASLFITMPDDLMPLIEVNRRKDLVDLKKVNHNDRIDNVFGEQVAIEKMSADFIQIRLSEKSIVQIKRLPLTDTTAVVAVVTTLSAPAEDSQISFYDEKWKALKTGDFLTEPGDKDFIKPGIKAHSEEYKEAESLIDMTLIAYDLDESRPELTARYTIGDYLPENVYSRIKPVLNEKPLIYVWDEKRFEEKK